VTQDVQAAAVRSTDVVIDREILKAHHAFVAGDNAWQQRARLTQALWRERKDVPAGLHRDAPLGSRLTTTDGEPPTLANYLSAPAKRQVKAAVAAARESGALLSRPRLWVDLLSSQPLCFNLFGPLAEDLDLATASLRLLWPHIDQVTEIKFEWSPGRGDEHYTGNRSAFDVFVAYQNATGRGFLGIEVKYHENLRGTAATDQKQRYPKIAAAQGVFRDDALSALQMLPLQQLWLDHLLALQLRASPVDGWDEGTFVFLSPAGNVDCTAAALRYSHALTDTTTFDARTLDELVQAIRLVADDPWADAVYERYLDPGPVSRALRRDPARPPR
jgi:hypothetical protein